MKPYKTSRKHRKLKHSRRFYIPRYRNETDLQITNDLEDFYKERPKKIK